MKENGMKGTYVLLIELPKSLEIQIGRLGRIKFQKGFYAYVGSALNGLKQRIDRHLRKDKKFHWHIDYLLDRADVQKVIYAKTSEKMECKIAESLLKNLLKKNLLKNSKAIDVKAIDGFGSSDCKCRSHLFFSKGFNNLNTSVLNAFDENGLNAEWIVNADVVNANG